MSARPRRLFGTDGVRGVAGDELSADQASGVLVCTPSPTDRTLRDVADDLSTTGQLPATTS